MGGHFTDSGAGDWLELDGVSPVTISPISMGAWVRKASNPGGDVIFVYYGEAASPTNYLLLGANSSGQFFGQFRDAGSIITSSTDYCDAIWHYVLWRTWYQTGVTYRHEFWVDGVQIGIDNTGTEATIANFNRIAAGKSRDSTPAGQVTGDVAELSIASYRAEIAHALALTRGASPHFVYGINLKLYLPLWRLVSSPTNTQEPEHSGIASNFTSVGCTVANEGPGRHPPVTNYGPMFMGASFVDGFDTAGLAIKRIIDESVSISEGVLTFLGLIRVIDESLSISEGVLTQRAMRRILDESISISEGALTFRTMVRVLNESVSIDEALLTLRAIKRIVDETVSVDEGILNFLGLIRVIDESVSISEDLLNFLGLIRVIDESMSISEGVISLKTILRIVNESLSINEGVLTPRVMARIVDESISISEGIVNPRVMVRLIDESISISEGALTQRTMRRIIDESLAISESTLNIRGLVKIINETISIAELIVKLTALGVESQPDIVTFTAYIDQLRTLAAYIDRIIESDAHIDQQRDGTVEK